jgi:hypothetical protein
MEKCYPVKNWSVREEVVPVKFNVKNSPLWNFEKVFMPPLHIKQGVMKKPLEVFDKGGENFLYLRIKFPNRSDDKIKQDIFVGLQVGNLYCTRISKRSVTPLN